MGYRDNGIKPFGLKAKACCINSLPQHCILPLYIGVRNYVHKQSLKRELRKGRVKKKKKISSLKRELAMALLQGDETHEVLKAQAHVWNHVFNFVNSMSLKCTVQLGIPDIVHNHGHPMTLSELVATLSIAPTRTAHVSRLMRLMVHSGFFAIQKINNDQGGDEEGYVLTPSSRLLLKDTTTCISPFLMMMLDPVLVTPWHFLSTWFVGDDRSPFHIAHKAGMWDFMAQSPELNNFFNEAMASDARLAMSIIVKECSSVFQGLRSLFDVGGGTGASARAIANSFPHVKCTVFDQPHVIASVPMSNDIDMVGGDMFESIPSADAVFLKWILHDWSDEDCVKILRRCKEAISSEEEGGKVIILDMVVNMNKDDYKTTEMQLYFDLMLLVLLCGKEREEHEWRKMFIDAGFTHYKITPVLGTRSIIEVYP
ncbi:trans-resveratrol di-O-methyltransferase-like [Magnolia sinica]|uniref:trans-resveratrol di-O-methyltransferase-like n=1 Tax=Magnolia sinica TaxID=86752 RepID=UPI002658E408|nr:trans-resveratrol di-O-methyltransferase-like [Magnolia sinica]